MTIRIARRSDAPRVAELLGELGYPSSAAESAARIAELSANALHVVFVAADSSDAATGCLHACVRHQLASEPFVQVASLVVAEAHRGAGVGAELLARAEAWARAQGIRLVRLRCNVTRVRAHGFYVRAGYALSKTSHLFTKTL